MRALLSRRDSDGFGGRVWGQPGADRPKGDTRAKDRDTMTVLRHTESYPIAALHCGALRTN